MPKLCCVTYTKKHQKLGKFGKPLKDGICYIQALLMLIMASLAKKPRNSYQQANPQKLHNRQVLLKDGKNNENCQKIGNKGSVTEATDTTRPLQLTNRFQPLLQIPMDDVCVSQPMLTDQTKITLVGKKTKMGFWTGVLITLATSSLHKSSHLAMVLQKKPNKQLVEQEIAFHKDCHGATTNSLSMHKVIDDDTQTGNLEPQY